MSKDIVKLHRYLESGGFKKEASFLLWLLSACSSENELIRIEKKDNNSGEPESEEVVNLTLDDFPSCVQTIKWLPEPDDERWSGYGVPLEEFKIVGRNNLTYGFSESEIVPGAVKGDSSSIQIILLNNMQFVMCIWSYIPDSDGYWASNYNAWEDAEGGELNEDVSSAYEQAPLVRVHCDFPLISYNNKYFVRLPDVNQGGSLTYHDLNDECVKEYIDIITEA